MCARRRLEQKLSLSPFGARFVHLDQIGCCSTWARPCPARRCSLLGRPHAQRKPTRLDAESPQVRRCTPPDHRPLPHPMSSPDPIRNPPAASLTLIWCAHHDGLPHWVGLEQPASLRQHSSQFERCCPPRAQAFIRVSLSTRASSSDAPLLWLRPAALPGGHRRQREPASSRPGTACTRQRAPLARSVRARLRVGSAQERAAAGRRRSRAASVADRPDSCSRVARTRLSAGGGVGVRVRSVFSECRGLGTIFFTARATGSRALERTIMHSSPLARVLDSSTPVPRRLRVTNRIYVQDPVGWSCCCCDKVRGRAASERAVFHLCAMHDEHEVVVDRSHSAPPPARTRGSCRCLPNDRRAEGHVRDA